MDMVELKKYFIPKRTLEKGKPYKDVPFRAKESYYTAPFHVTHLGLTGPMHTHVAASKEFGLGIGDIAIGQMVDSFRYLGMVVRREDNYSREADCIFVKYEGDSFDLSIKDAVEGMIKVRQEEKKRNKLYFPLTHISQIPNTSSNKIMLIRSLCHVLIAKTQTSCTLFHAGFRLKESII